MNDGIINYALHTLNSNSNKQKPDLIFVGTQSNLLAYDVERNADSFFVDVQDAMVVGKMNPNSKPLVLTGGNCSILGFDAKGYFHTTATFYQHVSTRSSVSFRLLAMIWS